MCCGGRTLLISQLFLIVTVFVCRAIWGWGEGGAGGQKGQHMGEEMSERGRYMGAWEEEHCNNDIGNEM